MLTDLEGQKTDDIIQLIDDIRLRNGLLGFTQRDVVFSSQNEQALSIRLQRLYSAEGVIIASIGSLIKEPLMAYVGTNAKVTVKHDELVDRSLVAFDLLSYEDHFSLPCKAMRDTVDETLQWLKQREIICIKEEQRSEHFQASNLINPSFWSHFDDQYSVRI